jgi:hypothetical protein
MGFDLMLEMARPVAVLRAWPKVPFAKLKARDLLAAGFAAPRPEKKKRLQTRRRQKTARRT